MIVLLIDLLVDCDTEAVAPHWASAVEHSVLQGLSVVHCLLSACFVLLLRRNF